MLLTATIDRAVPETPRTALVRLTLDGEFRFAAGQAAVIGAHGQPIRRPYSIAVGPAEAARDRALEFLIGLAADGSPGPHLPSSPPGCASTSKAHWDVRLSGPTNRTTLPLRGRGQWHRAVARDVASGPCWRRIVAHRGHLQREDTRGFCLRRRTASARRDGTRHLSSDRDTPFGQRMGGWLRPDQSRGTRPAVISADTLCFVCGPEALVHDVPGMLREMGMSTERIRVEEWGFQRPMM